jgi:hypothetical protein
MMKNGCSEKVNSNNFSAYSTIEGKNTHDAITFLRDIIEIVKIVGNEMNKGYAYKQDAEEFELDVLSRLFEVRSLDEEEKYCVFDVVLQTYLNYKKLKFTPTVLK